MVENFLTKMVPVMSTDSFPFRCTMCGACCRHVKTSVPLESLDVFRLTQYLKDKDENIQSMDDTLALYAEPVLLHQSGYFVFMLKTVGPDDACIFLRENNRCMIQGAKPRACRTYPISVGPARNGGLESYLSMEQPHHFDGPSISVGKWVQRRCSLEDIEFWKIDVGSAREISLLLERIPEYNMRRALMYFLLCKYSDYDLSRPFIEQFRQNTQKLLAALKELSQECL